MSENNNDLNKLNTYNKWAKVLEKMDISSNTHSWFDAYSKYQEPAIELHVNLPIGMKIAAQSIGLDLVTVQPLPPPLSSGETDEDKSKRLYKIRTDKLDAILNDKEFIWKEEYDPKPNHNLLFMDYTYNSLTASNI